MNDLRYRLFDAATEAVRTKGYGSVSFAVVEALLPIIETEIEERDRIIESLRNPLEGKEATKTN